VFSVAELLFGSVGRWWRNWASLLRVGCGCPVHEQKFVSVEGLFDVGRADGGRKVPRRAVSRAGRSPGRGTGRMGWSESPKECFALTPAGQGFAFQQGPRPTEGEALSRSVRRLFPAAGIRDKVETSPVGGP